MFLQLYWARREILMLPFLERAWCFNPQEEQELPDPVAGPCEISFSSDAAQIVLFSV